MVYDPGLGHLPSSRNSFLLNLTRYELAFCAAAPAPAVAPANVIYLLTSFLVIE